MVSFEERIYQLGSEALSEQERQVAEVRGRGSTLLAAGAVIASLLAKPVFHNGHPNGALETLEEQRETNTRAVRRLVRFLAVALGALVVETAGLAAAAALAS
ncbi:MAG TPA: hypothetical protein VN618_07465 [Solirubrobacteraceae bacterium]|nr:hypothetical protein [Solirubrobacteraceae bacterium]